MDRAETLRRRDRAGRAAAAAILVGSLSGIVLTLAGWRGEQPPDDVGTVPDRSPSASSVEPEPLGVALPARAVIATHPARLDGFTPPMPLRPVRLTVEPGGVAAEVVAVGVDSTGAGMELPPDASVAAWYEHGPTPGAPGSAVVAGHVDFNGRAGAFIDLARIEPGATVTVEFEDSSSRTFSVTARRTYAKADLPVSELFRQDGPATLVLVTCGGSFDRTTRSYRDNVVLYAVPS